MRALNNSNISHFRLSAYVAMRQKMPSFIPSDLAFSASHIDCEGSTVKLNDLSSSDSIYPTTGPRSQDQGSSNMHTVAQPQRKAHDTLFKRKISQRILKSTYVGDLDASARSITSSSQVVSSLGHTLPNINSVYPKYDDVLTVDSSQVLLTSPNESSSELENIRCYTGNESITILQSDMTDTRPLLLPENKSPSVQLPPSASSFPQMPLATCPELPRFVRSAKGTQRISFTNSFMAVFGGTPSGPVAPQPSLNNTAVKSIREQSDAHPLPRSKSAALPSSNEKLEASEHSRKSSQIPRASIPRADEQTTATDFAQLGTTFIQNAIIASMHAMGVENRQELVALQAVVDEQAKSIAELTARIKVLEARQNISTDKLTKITRTINVLNPELVLRLVKYQKELDATLKTISRRQDTLSEDSTRRLNDLRELVADFPIILARLTNLEKELLESKALIEKLQQEVLG